MTRPALDLAPVLRVLPLALPATVLSEVLRAWATTEPLPPFPRAVLAVAGLLAALGLVAAFATRRPAALWPCALALPLALQTIELRDPIYDGYFGGPLRAFAAAMAWDATFGPLVLWLWLGGWRRGFRGLPEFVALVGLKLQATRLPLLGMLVAAAFALLEVVLARERPAGAALRDIARAPGAFGVALAAPYVAGFAAFGLVVGQLALEPTGGGVPLLLAAAVPASVAASILGLLIALAGALYDRAAPSDDGARRAPLADRTLGG